MDIKLRIQEKANELFRRYGIKSITMDEIATQLGVSKKTLYLYFSDKEELVEAVVRNTIKQAQQICNENRDNSKDAVHELFAAMDLMQLIFSEMNPAMMYDLEKFHPASYRLFLEHKNKYLYDVIRDNLRRGIEQDLYRPEIDIDLVAKIRLECMMASFNQDVFPPSRYNLSKVHTALIEHFAFGVASLKGHRLISKYQQERTKITQ